MSGTGGAALTVRAGLDEAGYGPLLGPLTVGYSAFRCAAGGDVGVGGVGGVGGGAGWYGQAQAHVRVLVQSPVVASVLK